jgi:hypothetical protein
MLNQVLKKVRELLNKVQDWKPLDRPPLCRVIYTSAPVWKPWREY